MTSYLINSKDEEVFKKLLFLMALILINPFIGIIISSYLVLVINKSISFFFNLFALFFFVIFYSSIDVYSDLSEYIHIFNNIESIGIFSYSRFGGGIEFIILIIAYISNFLSPNNDFLFLFIVYFIIQLNLMLASYSVCRKLSLLIYLSFNLSLMFIQYEVYFLRSSLGISFIILGLSMTSRIRYFFYLTSFFCHISNVLFISIITFSEKLRFNFRSFAILVVMFLFAIYIIQYLNLYSYVLARISFDLSSGIPIKSSILTIVFINMMLVLYVKFYFRSRVQGGKLNRPISFLLVYSIFSLFLFNGDYIYLLRLSPFIVSFHIIFIFPFLKSEIIPIKTKVSLLSMFLLFNFLAYIYTISLIENNLHQISVMNNSPLSGTFYNLYSVVLDKFSSGDVVILNDGN
ncbi:MAG: hypothetical protein ACI88H_001166 [Cocleimonas sp.]